ncbi:cytoskeletal protein CcmA (bactofilin family) [Anaerosolibacter carboniphilus]|uniref:Cytoskeletal protein CcmA (Bactofilin family) n=1 Tax=Anaerosolibacter carboniphilus TaxID=1417629 RepID=A0A841KVA4_9FIRM|nr:polymer-forming cytoskeletal protein [Anaerosolibacter carboniphilus]MBB6217584.1 cytoskeletal protein CcmA (bactofilin family) [Anaerosolibacter carboniphilus]
MKGRIYLLILVLLISSLPIVAFADNDQTTNIVIKQDESLPKDFFGAGDSIRNHGTVQGDVFAASGEFENTGTVKGDILAVGRSSVIDGMVEGDVRVASGTVVIEGEVEKNVTAFAGDFSMAEGAAVDGSINVFAGNIIIDGIVGGDLRSGAGTAQINGVVKGDVWLETDQINFGPNGKIEGNLVYSSERELQIPEGVVAGKVEYKKSQIRINDEAKKKAEEGIKVMHIVWKAAGIAAYLIIATILTLLFSRFMLGTADTIQRKPWHAIGIGLVALIVTPVAAILFMITVIGIPLGVISFVLYGLAIYLAQLPGALWLGRLILKGEEKPLLPILLGVFILRLVSFIPYLGGFVSFLAVSFGMGAYLINIVDAIQNSKGLKVIEE